MTITQSYIASYQVPQSTLVNILKELTKAKKFIENLGELTQLQGSLPPTLPMVKEQQH